MADQLQKLVSQKKDVVETIMEVFEQGAEVVASIAGDLFPVFSIAAPIVKLALDNVESKEAEYMKEQFQKVRDRLEVVSEEVQQINQEIKKSGIDETYFSVEENLTNQFRKFTEVRKKTFLEHFNRTGGDKNLHTLYNAVTGDNFSGESVLEITLNYEQKSRRVVEEFCATLKKLFCVGLIALLGHAALKGNDDEEKLLQDWSEKMKVVQSVLEITLNYEQKSRRVVEEFCATLKKLFCVGLIALLGHAALKGNDDEEKLLQDWSEKMKVVQDKMNVVIEDCINSFPTQAELDAKHIVRDQSDKSNQQLADLLVEHLKKKYDWVCWSVRVFNSPTGLFTSKKDFHSLTGKSRFQVPSSDDKLNVVVSYSASPEPVDKARIQSLISEQKKITMTPLAELLFETIPVCVVHTIKTSCKDLGFSSSFSDELHFFEEFKSFCVFLHSA
uniref:Rapunzel 4 n=1 Tax=Sinocyclocheilus rhinocerous TaxID=307959 RepID=A0A673N517_9TELE